MLNRLLILTLGLAILFLFGSARPTFIEDDAVIIINKIRIEITGTSTVGKYNCSNLFTTKDTVYLNSIRKNIFNTEIKMSNFDCGNKIMTKDLQGTVKIKQFPNSTVCIRDIRQVGKNYKCNLNFLITNKILRYKDFILYNSADKIQGSLNLKFSDIELEPPTKMAGLIKVKDNLIINFSLYK